MTASPLVPKSSFRDVEDVAHLCSGGESPWLKSHADVFERFSQLKSAGFDGRETVLAEVGMARAKIGRLWNVDASRIVFMPAANEGMNYLARGIDWQPGDSIVTTSLEFPSVAWAWRDLQARGVDVRFVQPRGWLLSEDDLLDAVDDSTRLLAVSQVSYYTGQQLDIAKLAAGLDRNRTLFAVDATHASGVNPVRAELSDLTISSSYKWMLGTTGTAACYVSEKAQLESKPTTWGWNNLQYAAPPVPLHTSTNAMPALLEPGNVALLNIMFLSNALDLILDTGIERIDRHARALAASMRTALLEIGMNVISPEDPNKQSGNTSIQIANCQAVTDQLSTHGVLVWGDRERIRLSTHLYNDANDVVRARDALAACVPIEVKASR